jgi:hypothetical protein
MKTSNDLSFSPFFCPHTGQYRISSMHGTTGTKHTYSLHTTDKNTDGSGNCMSHLFEHWRTATCPRREFMCSVRFSKWTAIICLTVSTCCLYNGDRASSSKQNLLSTEINFMLEKINPKLSKEDVSTARFRPHGDEDVRCSSLILGTIWAVLWRTE